MSGEISPGDKAPPFSLPRWGGGTISFPPSRSPSTNSALGVKSLLPVPTLLVFFKTSCPTSAWALPFYERLQTLAGTDVLSVLGVAEDEEADLAPFASELGLTFPIALEPGPYATSAAYGLTTVPTLFFVREDGIIELVSVGFARDDVLEIARRAAARAGTPAVSPFSDDVPAFRPG